MSFKATSGQIRHLFSKRVDFGEATNLHRPDVRVHQTAYDMGKTPHGNFRFTGKSGYFAAQQNDLAASAG
ncbi:hypothetical protein [Hyphomonas johnsonii]|uniref:hypothetical protein n=1 Tax=Hyphomonas johnsonii TaxID=81031 RepID=UPI0012EB4517|nr:hypothetical protein [Hyphomonas johnsonii]